MTRPPEASEERLLSGWGRTSPSRATVVRPVDPSGIASAFVRRGGRGALARGLGRSYGDAAQNAGGLVLDMTGLDAIERFDDVQGIITARAGVSFDRILHAIVPRGWFLPVTPGTQSVTLGGAIASDVHGKNHHRDGGFGDHVVAFDLMGADGVERTITPDADAEVFAATLGGMGLTGVLTRATLRLLRVETSRMRIDTERGEDLDDLMARMDRGDHRYRYSVAWIDCLARGRRLGRGVLTRAYHALVSDLARSDRSDPMRYRPRALASVPSRMPNLVRPDVVRAFNEVWFRKAPREERGRISPLAPFFYPLDAIADWNHLYGRRGFVQYQLLVPFGRERTIRTVIERIAGAGCASLLAVLKRFGPGRSMLSFPAPGWTLALDLPADRAGLPALLDGIDRNVLEAGGRIYLAKDARLDPRLLPEMYPQLASWREVREGLDPHHVFRSDLGRRLELGVDARREVLV